MSRYPGKDRHWKRRKGSRKSHIDNVTLDEREKNVNHWSTPQFNYQNCGYNSSQYANYSTFPYQLPNSWQYQFFDQPWRQGPPTWLTQNHSNSQRPWQGNSSYGNKFQYHRASSSFQQETEQGHEPEQRALPKSRSPPPGSEEARKKALAQAADKLKLCLQSFEPQKSEVLENLLANKEDNVGRLKKDKKRQEPKSSLSVLDRSHFVPELQLTPKDLKDIGMVNSGAIVENPSDMSDVTIVSESYRAIIDTIALEDSDGSLCCDESLGDSSLDPTLSSVENDKAPLTPIKDVAPNNITKEPFFNNRLMTTCSDNETLCELERMDVASPCKNDASAMELPPTVPLFPGPQSITRRARYTSESLTNNNSDKPCSFINEESHSATTKLRARSASLCLTDTSNDGDVVKNGSKNLSGSPGHNSALDNRGKGLKKNIIQQLLSMSKSNLKDLVNNPRSRKLEFAMKHLVKEHRMLLSRQLRALAQARIQGRQILEDQDSLMDPDSVLLDPDLAVNLSSLPLEIIEQLGNILQMDLLDCMAPDSDGNAGQDLEEFEALQEVLCSGNQIHDGNKDPNVLSELDTAKIDESNEQIKCDFTVSNCNKSGLKPPEEIASDTEIKKIDQHQLDKSFCDILENNTSHNELNKEVEREDNIKHSDTLTIGTGYKENEILAGKVMSDIRLCNSIQTQPSSTGAAVEKINNKSIVENPEPHSPGKHDVASADVQIDSSLFDNAFCNLPHSLESDCSKQRPEVSNKEPVETERTQDIPGDMKLQDKTWGVTPGKTVQQVEHPVEQQSSSCNVGTQTQSSNDLNDAQHMLLLLEQSSMIPLRLSQLLQDHLRSICHTADIVKSGDCISVDTAKDSEHVCDDLSKNGDCSSLECTVKISDNTDTNVIKNSDFTCGVVAKCSDSTSVRITKRDDFISPSVKKNSGTRSGCVAKRSCITSPGVVKNDLISTNIAESSNHTTTNTAKSVHHTITNICKYDNTTANIMKTYTHTSTDITKDTSAIICKSNNHTIANNVEVGECSSVGINKGNDDTVVYAAESVDKTSANITRSENHPSVNNFNNGTNAVISKCSHCSVLKSPNIPKSSNDTNADSLISIDFSKKSDHTCDNISKAGDNINRCSNATCADGRDENTRTEITKNDDYSNTNFTKSVDCSNSRSLSFISSDIAMRANHINANVIGSSGHHSCTKFSGIGNTFGANGTTTNSTSLNTCNVNRTEQSIYLEMLKIDKEIQSLMGYKIELYKKLKFSFNRHSCRGDSCATPQSFAGCGLVEAALRPTSQTAATAGNYYEQTPMESVMTERNKPMVYLPVQIREPLPSVIHSTKYQDRNMFVTCGVEAFVNSALPEQSTVRNSALSENSAHSHFSVGELQKQLPQKNALNKHFKEIDTSVGVVVNTSGSLECRVDPPNSNVSLPEFVMLPKSLESTSEKLLNFNNMNDIVNETDSIKKAKRSKLSSLRDRSISKQEKYIQNLDKISRSDSLADHNISRSRNNNRQKSSTLKKQNENSDYMEQDSKLIRVEKCSKNNSQQRRGREINEGKKKYVRNEQNEVEEADSVTEIVGKRNIPCPALGSTTLHIRTKTASVRTESSPPLKAKQARRKTECEALATPEKLATVLSSGRRRRVSSQVAEPPRIEEQLPLLTDKKITRSSKAPKLFPVNVEPTVQSKLLTSRLDTRNKRDMYNPLFSDMCELSGSSKLPVLIQREELELDYQLDTPDAYSRKKGEESELGCRPDATELHNRKMGRKSDLNNLVNVSEMHTKRKGRESHSENHLYTLKPLNEKKGQKLESKVCNRKKGGRKSAPEMLNIRKEQGSDSEQQSDSYERCTRKKEQMSKSEDILNVFGPYIKKKEHEIELEQQSLEYKILDIKKEPDSEFEQYSDVSEVHKGKTGLKPELDHMLDSSVVCNRKIKHKFECKLDASGLFQENNDRRSEHHSDLSEIFSLKFKQESESKRQSDASEGLVMEKREEYGRLSDSEHQSDTSEASATTVSKMRSFRMKHLESKKKIPIRSEHLELSKNISSSICSSNERKRKVTTSDDGLFTKRKCLTKQVHQEVIRECFVLLKPLTSKVLYPENISEINVTNIGESSTQSESCSFLSDLNNSCGEDMESRTIKPYMIEQECTDSEALASSSEDELPIKKKIQSTKEHSRPATPLDPTREIESQLALLEQMSSQLVKHPAQKKHELNKLPIEADQLSIELNALPTRTDLLSSELGEHSVQQDTTVLEKGNSPLQVILPPDVMHDDNSISTLVSDTVSVQSDVEPASSKRLHYEASTIEDCDKDSVCSSKSARHKSPRKHKHDKKSESVERMVFQDHSGPILDIKTIGKHFLAASEDGNVYCYSLKSGKMKRKYEGHKAAVICLCLSDCTTNELQSEEGERTPELVFTGSLDNQLRCFAFKTGVLILQPVDIGSPIQCMDQNWGTIFLGTKGGDIVKFHIESSKLMGDPMKCSKESILTLKARKEGPRKVLVVGTRNGPITIRDAYSGLLMRTVTNRWPHTVYSLLLDTSLVYCGTKSGIIPIIEFATGDEKFRFQAGVGVVCMKIYNNLLFAGCYDGNIYIYSIQDESLLTCIPGPGKMLLCLDVIKNRIIAGSKDNTLQACTFPTEVRNYLKEAKHR